MFLKPSNRHLLVKIEDDDGDASQPKILLPDEFVQKPAFSQAVVVEKSNDCKLDILKGESVVFPSNMLETVTIKEKEFFLLLENYVLGIIQNERD